MEVPRRSRKSAPTGMSDYQGFGRHAFSTSFQCPPWQSICPLASARRIRSFIQPPLPGPFLAHTFETVNYFGHVAVARARKVAVEER